MIPKILHIYWDDGPLSFLQYLTVVSFKKHNPNWKVWLWEPTVPDLIAPAWSTGEQKDPYTGPDYLGEMKKLCVLKKIDFKSLGIKNELPATQRSDVLRWYLLYNYGGGWSDCDFLYIRPIDELLKDDFDALISYRHYPAMGFFLVKPKVELFNYLYETAHDLLRRNMADGYQALCADVFLRFGGFKDIQATYPDTKFINMPDELVYPYHPLSNIDGIFAHDIYEMFFGTEDKTTPKTIGIHWYNGHALAKKYQNNFDEYHTNDSAISKYARDYDVFYNNAT